MNDATRYRFQVHYEAEAPGTPRPVGLSARTARIIYDALIADGFNVVESAHSHNVGVEVTEMRYLPDPETE
jgi:hypothetical protein